jgi:hypothetical protein
VQMLGDDCSHYIGHASSLLARCTHVSHSCAQTPTATNITLKLKTRKTLSTRSFLPSPVKHRRPKTTKTPFRSLHAFTGLCRGFRRGRAVPSGPARGRACRQDGRRGFRVYGRCPSRRRGPGER